MKSISKILFLLLGILIPIVAAAHDFEVDGIYYNINGNEVSVTFKGSYATHYLNEYSGDVTIPDTVYYNGITYSVTAILYCAFYSCSGLTSVTIPESVTYIGSSAFYSCSGLASVTIPESVTYIGSQAFYSCSGLASVTIPESVTYIDEEAFSGCTGLTSIEIPNSVTYIGSQAFYSCSGLASVTIPESVTYIDEEAFSGCTGLTSIEIPNSVTSIGSKAFFGCENLISVVFPNTFISLGHEVFSETPWYNNQPDGMVYAGKIAYKYKGVMPPGTTISLEEGTLGIAASAFKDIGGLENIRIPNSVITIGESAFENCIDLVNIEIPNSVVSIGNKAFYFCTNLINVHLGNSVVTIGDMAFSDCSRFRFYYKSDIIFPASVRHIGNRAFFNTYFDNISFEGDIEYLGYMAFDSCDGASLELLAFYGNIKNDFGYQSFWHKQCFNDKGPRRSQQLIIGSDVDSIKGMNIEPGVDTYSYSPVPPIADEKTFSSYNGTLHVPANSLAKYFTDPYWSNFSSIIGDAVEPMEITMDKDSIEMQLGNQAIKLNATVKPINATTNKIIWTSSNISIAKVDLDGNITATGVGECDIIAHCLNKKAICHVVVNDTTVTITLDQQEAMVLPNHIITFTPSASPVMPDLVVSSSDPTVAATRLVNGKVQVVGIKEGTTTITVGSADGTAVPATCIVTVYTELGDTNMDGFVNISDVTQMIDYLLGSEVSIFKEANADLNGDDSVTIGDVTALIDLLLSAGN